MGPWFMDFTSWYSLMLKTLILDLWYSWNLWLTLWACVWSPNPNFGAIYWRFYCGSLLLGLRSLIGWLESWNPNHGYFSFMVYVGLTFDLRIDSNPNSLGLVLDHHVMYHQSSSFLFSWKSFINIDHLIYISICLGIHLIQCLVQVFMPCAFYFAIQVRWS